MSILKVLTDIRAISQKTKIKNTFASIVYNDFLVREI